MPAPKLTSNLSLPADGFAGALAGRVWRPDQDGPSVVAIRANGVIDISRAFPTMRDLCETENPAAALHAADGEPLGALEAILANTPPDGRDRTRPWLLAPIDLQAVKAAGVTFAVSMLERVIEERARGNPAAAAAIRSEICRIVDATIGNDVNLRDVEGRSALRLGKCKDNNASCALGPFLSLFDATFALDDVRRMNVTLTVEGDDGFRLEGFSSIAKISRDPADLVAQMLGEHQQYPDGAVLFLGTMFAPIEDRDAPGGGFTHKIGDIVTIAAPKLGRLVNRMRYTNECEPWRFGTGHLMRNLARRGLL